MSTFAGQVSFLFVDTTKATFGLKSEASTAPPGSAGPAPGIHPTEFKLYVDAPGTHTIPQLELARRSWMISIVQNAYFKAASIEVTYDTAHVVTALKLAPTAAAAHPGTHDPGTHVEKTK